jgi:hypothetical protein
MKIEEKGYFGQSNPVKNVWNEKIKMEGLNFNFLQF